MIIFIGSLLQILLLVIVGVGTWRSLALNPTQTEIFFRRWSQNISLEIINRLSLPLFLFPLTFLLNIQLKLNWFSDATEFRIGYFLFAMLVIDFVFYWRHRIYHLYFKKWHDTHHNDTGYDISLTLRFHPVENFLNYLILFGLIFFLKLNSLEAAWMIQMFALQAFISHCYKFKTAGKWQHYLGGILITPFLHQSHHNHEARGCNFGFMFSIWDRVFKTLVMLVLVVGIQLPETVYAEQAEQKAASMDMAEPPPAAMNMESGARVRSSLGPSSMPYYVPQQRPNLILIYSLAAVGFVALILALVLFYRAGKVATGATKNMRTLFILGAVLFLVGTGSLTYSAYLRGKSQMPFYGQPEFDHRAT